MTSRRPQRPQQPQFCLLATKDGDDVVTVVPKVLAGNDSLPHKLFKPRLPTGAPPLMRSIRSARIVDPHARASPGPSNTHANVAATEHPANHVSRPADDTEGHSWAGFRGGMTSASTRTPRVSMTDLLDPSRGVSGQKLYLPHIGSRRGSAKYFPSYAKHASPAPLYACAMTPQIRSGVRHRSAQRKVACPSPNML